MSGAPTTTRRFVLAGGGDAPVGQRLAAPLFCLLSAGQFESFGMCTCLTSEQTYTVLPCVSQQILQYSCAPSSVQPKGRTVFRQRSSDSLKNTSATRFMGSHYSDIQSVCVHQL
ncbi:hypothetical protein BS78_04G031400 [Paspalum vaginatum]|nr:hypothetical protein BS78_04G031400 [Paspalum vaginatum]